MSRRGRLYQPDLRSRACIPVDMWPANDQNAWAKAVRIGSPLEPGGWASQWAAGSRRKAEADYGRWLGWLEKEGELDPATAPESRVIRERVGQYLSDLQRDLSPFSVQSRLQGLADVLRVMTESAKFQWIARGAARLRTRASSVRNKRSAIRSPDQLVDLGMTLMAGAGLEQRAASTEAALQYRNGLIIAFLAFRPIRVGNLAQISVGKHLARRNNLWWLVFSEKETKQRRRLEFPLPTCLEPALRRYLEIFRPILWAQGAHRGTAGHALWISQDGGALTSTGIAQAIRRLTKAEFGAAISPHLFRDCAATAIAIDDPEHVGIIAGILGHSTLSTSERHYNQARGLEAGRRYHATLKRIRSRQTGARNSGTGER